MMGHKLVAFVFGVLSALLFCVVACSCVGGMEQVGGAEMVQGGLELCGACDVARGGLGKESGQVPLCAGCVEAGDGAAQGGAACVGAVFLQGGVGGSVMGLVQSGAGFGAGCGLDGAGLGLVGCAAGAGAGQVLGVGVDGMELCLGLAGVLIGVAVPV